MASGAAVCYPQAVADGVNVNDDVYRLKTEVTEAGSKVEAGCWRQVLDKPTRARRDWQLDDDFEYAPEQMDRSVQTSGQIGTIPRTLRDLWQTELYPQLQERPKTLVVAKDGNHAEASVAEQRRIVAEVDRCRSIVREVEAEVDVNLKRAQALRQAVLAPAFGGSVTPHQTNQS